MAEKVLFETGLTDTGDVDIEGVGITRKVPDGKIYRWVKNNSAVDFLAGQPVCCDETGGAGSSTSLVKEVEHGTDTNVGVFAGIAMSAIAAGEFGWILKEGFYADAKCSVGTDLNLAVGDNLKVQTGTNPTTAASATVLVLGTALGTAPLYRYGATSLETDTATSAALLRSVNVFVNGI